MGMNAGGGAILAHRVRQSGYAGAPGWVSTIAAADSVVLYGTPAEEDVGDIPLMVGGRGELLKGKLLLHAGDCRE